ncbi:hypothetical protein N431DRAFT_417354 [Stipitochalara longipes BDJ]|nr:hypothetical protein N431DRAFT_417354 [Stipitochalara longipes BDJ]
MNLTSCGEKFSSIPDWQDYGEWSNNTGIPGPQRVISLDGCKRLCGLGADTYDWMSIANTITTWVFPIIGILLQAPFESNNTKGTLFALLRWLGSPISSLSYIFWNIKVSGRAALIVDMATKYKEHPGSESDFSEIRDSFYILTVMNQYTIKRKMRTPPYGPDVAEKLLRTALFDDILVVNGEKLSKIRKRTANHLRQSRKQGVVAVFISMGWFLFSLAISIQAVFSDIGPVEQADNLGLGLMLSWIPVLILSGIVDRNPANSSSVENSLNELVGTCATKMDWVNALNEVAFQGDFFVGFGGQGRRRWHYGVANAILAGLEDEFIKQYGRNWLSLDNARDRLAKPGKSPGIYFFDLRELWHVASSGLVIVGTMFGAFILSYFTPPIGIGCRSGGYTIFCCLATLSFVVEMVVWWWTSKHTNDEFREQEKWARWFFIPMEIIALSWLLYIVIAQSAGLYNSCWCLSWEGSFDFTTAKSWTGPSVQGHWITALCLTLVIMLVSFVFIIIEWCTQSHMATHSYVKAMQGLARTRTFKRLTSPISELMDFAITKFKLLFGRRRRSLVWRKGPEQHSEIKVLDALALKRPDEAVENIRENNFKESEKSNETPI